MAWVVGIASNVLLAAILALAAWLSQRWLRRPALARVLWVLVLVKLVTPAVWSLPVGQASGRLVCLLGNCNCGQHALARTIVHDTLPWILLAAWSAGAVATAAVAWHRWRHLGHLLKHARPAPKDWQALADRLGRKLALRRRVEVLAVPGRLPPLVVGGLGRPRMLVPEVLIERLEGSQRKALLLHELVHIRHGDHLVRILELAAGVVFWWLPLGVLIGRQLRACEEACCDRSVVARLPGARRDYAALILDVLDFTSPLPPQAMPHATAMSAAGDLERRLRGILDRGRAARRSWPAGLLAAGLAVVILPCGLHYDLGGSAAASGPFARIQFDEVSCPAESAEPPAKAVRHFNAVRLEAVGCCPQRQATAAAEPEPSDARGPKPPVFSCPSQK